jgi:integrase
MARRGIYKQKGSKNWWLRYAGLDGRIVYESSGSNKFSDAENLLIQRKKSIREGKKPELKTIGRCTFRELVQQYLAWTNGRQKSAKNRGYIASQLLERFGNLPLRSFNTMLVEQLQTELMDRKLKNSSCNTVIGVLKRMFTKAVEWEMVEEEVLKRIRKVKPLRDDSKRMRYLSREECQALISACGTHLVPIIVTALNTGMRKGEILSLKWDNVDFRHGFILLDRTKNGERREVPINDTVRRTLTSLTRRLDIPYVFYDPITGKKYDDVKRSFKTACKKAGITDFHFHDLRHTFASQLVMGGVDLTTVSRLLGHKSLTMTLRYSHLAPAHMAKAVSVLDDVLGNKVSSVAERFTQQTI